MSRKANRNKPGKGPNPQGRPQAAQQIDTGANQPNAEPIQRRSALGKVASQSLAKVIFEDCLLNNTGPPQEHLSGQSIFDYMSQLSANSKYKVALESLTAHMQAEEKLMIARIYVECDLEVTKVVSRLIHLTGKMTPTTYSWNVASAFYAFLAAFVFHDGLTGALADLAVQNMEAILKPSEEMDSAEITQCRNAKSDKAESGDATWKAASDHMSKEDGPHILSLINEHNFFSELGMDVESIPENHPRRFVLLSKNQPQLKEQAMLDFLRYQCMSQTGICLGIGQRNFFKSIGGPDVKQMLREMQQDRRINLDRPYNEEEKKQ